MKNHKQRRFLAINFYNFMKKNLKLTCSVNLYFLRESKSARYINFFRRGILSMNMTQ